MKIKFIQNILHLMVIHAKIFNIPLIKHLIQIKSLQNNQLTDIKGLEKALQQAGLETNSNSFNFGLKQNSAQKGDSNLGPNNGHDGASSELADTQDDEIDPGILMKQHEYGHNASTNGGIDIQV